MATDQDKMVFLRAEIHMNVIPTILASMESQAQQNVQRVFTIQKKSALVFGQGTLVGMIVSQMTVPVHHKEIKRKEVPVKRIRSTRKINQLKYLLMVFSALEEN